MQKRMTRARLDAFKKHSAIAFDRLQDDPDEADRIDSLVPEEFAAERGIEIINNLKLRGKRMASLRDQVVDLKARVSELEEENEELLSRFEDIQNITGEVFEEDDSSSDDED